MAHYSSHYIYYEGGAKNPLKSISVKLLVLAYFAQIWVGAERLECWATVMAYDFDPAFMETYDCYKPIHASLTDL